MVLADLGRKLQGAFKTLSSEPIIDEKTLDLILKEICTALLESDVNVRLVQQFRKNIKSVIQSDPDFYQTSSAGVNKGSLGISSSMAQKKKSVHKTIFNELCKLVDPGTPVWKPIRSTEKKHYANVVMFVGLQGAGKTTTCTKFAYFYQRKGLKVGLVCCDTFRAGAFDQLKQNAAKAKIPFYGSYTESDPVQLAIEGVGKFKEDKFELILVDTSGRHKQEMELFKEMKQISEGIQPDTVVFVMDGTIGQAAELQAKAFKETVNVGSIVMTKMDGHAKGGGALSAVAATGSPIIFIGTGEHMYDFDAFDPQKFIGKLLGMGDISGLIETVKDMKLSENKDMMKRLEQGIFTLGDMRDQFQTIMGMGPLSKVMSMMPGLPEEFIQMGGKEGTQQIKRFMVMFDSMTRQELASDGKMFSEQPTRIARVSKGSGTNEKEVEMLLMQCSKFAEMVKKLGGLKNMKAPAKGHPSQMNPRNQMQQMQNMMQSMMPPGMMEQMGGMGNLQNMMQQMGGMGNIQNMMQQMGGGNLANLLGDATRGGKSSKRR